MTNPKKYIGATLSMLAAIVTAGLIYVGRRRRLRLYPTEILVGNHQYDSTNMIGRSVTKYNGAASGDVPPSGEFLTDSPAALILDSDKNIYVASYYGHQVLVYPPDQSGQVPAIRNIHGVNTGLFFPTGLAIDVDGNLYVADRGGTSDQSAILKFGPLADGNAGPNATIPSITRAPNTQLQVASGVAVDSSRRIYVADHIGGQLLIFDSGAQDNVAPNVIIRTGLRVPVQVALDDDENIYVADRGQQPCIVVYAARPTANSIPMRIITSPDLIDPFGLAIDRRGQIYVANAGQDSVLVFEEGASGNSIPIFKIGGASNNAIPIRKIRGDRTRLKTPLAITLRYG